MFKTISKLALAMSVAVCAANVQAAEPTADGNMSQSALSAMGLSGLQTADTAAREVRGQGFTVSGFSFARARVQPADRFFLPSGTIDVNSGPITVSNNDFAAQGSISTSVSSQRFSFFGRPVGPRIPNGNLIYAGGVAVAY